MSPSTRQTVSDVGGRAVFTPNSHLFPAIAWLVQTLHPFMIPSCEVVPEADHVSPALHATPARPRWRRRRRAARVMTSVTLSAVTPHLMARVFLSPCRMASVKAERLEMEEKRMVPSMVSATLIVVVGVFPCASVCGEGEVGTGRRCR